MTSPEAHTEVSTDGPHLLGSKPAPDGRSVQNEVDVRSPGNDSAEVSGPQPDHNEIEATELHIKPAIFEVTKQVERAPKDFRPTQMPSPEDIVPPRSQYTRVGLPDETLSKYERIAKLQDRILLDQSRLELARDTVTARLDSFKASIAQYMQLAEPAEQEISDPHRVHALRASYSQLLQDVASLEGQTQKVSEFEESLARQIYRLARLQPKLLKSIDSAFETKRQRTERSSSADSSQLEHEQSPILDATENQYYDKRGNVRLLQVKIFNLQAELQRLYDRAAAIPFLSDEERVSNHQNPIPLEQLQGEYAKMRQILLQEELSMKELWHACKEAGLDVGPLDPEFAATLDMPDTAPSPSPSPSIKQVADTDLDTPPFFSSKSMPKILQDIHWSPRGVFVSPAIPDFAGLFEKRNSIEHWRGMIPDVGFGATAEHSQATEFEHRLSIPKHDTEWLLIHRNSQPMQEYVVINADDLDVPGEGSPLRKGSRRVLRRWWSDDALTPGSARTSRSHLAALNTEQSEESAH